MDQLFPNHHGWVVLMVVEMVAYLMKPCWGVGTSVAAGPPALVRGGGMGVVAPYHGQQDHGGVCHTLNRVGAVD